MLYLGHTLLIANPTARSGKAEKIALTAHKKHFTISTGINKITASFAISAG